MIQLRCLAARLLYGVVYYLSSFYTSRRISFNHSNEYKFKILKLVLIKFYDLNVFPKCSWTNLLSISFYIPKLNIPPIWKINEFNYK